MCGILGTIPATPESPFKKALDLLTHRGPDGYDIWNDDDQNVTLGHRRLSILDLSDAGNEPMHYGRYVITFNGEIYNYLELKKDLENKGHQFKSSTDTEVLLAAFLEWGPDCLPKFNGMWAFAIWDKQEKKLYLARDRFGEKPLFYAFVNDKLVFASEMKAIIPFLYKVELSKDFQWMKANLFDYEPTEKCLIEGVKRFPAAHWGLYENGNLKTHRYWNTLDHIHTVPSSYRKQVEEFRELFIDACKIRMRSDVPVGTALSGGIDSTATICSMAHIIKTKPEDQTQKSWQHAFVASLPGTALDETKYAKTVTDYLGIPATFVEIDPAKAIDQFESYLYQLEELYITNPAPMIQTYEACRKEGVYVSIDGHGADELFAGYDTFLFRAFLDCGLNPFAIRNILKTYRGLAEKGEQQFQQQEVGFVNYLRWVTGYDHIGSLKPHLKKELKKTFTDQTIKKNGNVKITSTEQLGNLNKGLYELFHTNNLPTLLRNYDRFSMTSGVEIRMPFLDHRIVNYCFSVPWTSKLRNGLTKSLLRDAIAPFAPKEIVNRSTKMGFQTPIVDWLKGTWKEYFLDMVDSSSFQNSDLVDGKQLKKEMHEIIDGDKVTYRRGELAYAAMSPYLWEQNVLRKFQEINKQFIAHDLNPGL